MVIIETALFSKLIQAQMSEEEYRSLQESLIARPDSGKLIKGSGGLRKLRWGSRGAGKRGGARIIYYWLSDNNQLLMLYVYTKTAQDNLAVNQLAELRKILERW